MQAQRAGTAERTGLLVAEPVALVREGLAGLLGGWPHGAVRAAGSTAAAMALLEQDSACVLLLDGGLCGPDVFRARHAGLRIVVLAAEESRDGVLGALAAGAHGYVAKTAGFAELARAIEVVRGGGVHVPATLAGPGAGAGAEARPAEVGAAGIAGAGAGAPRHPGRLQGAEVLTGRQRDVLRLLAEGRSTKDIARTLDLAVSTIKVHLAAVYRTFGARNRVEALCRAGVLPLPSSPTSRHPEYAQ